MKRIALVTTLGLLAAPLASATEEATAPNPTIVISESGGDDGGNAAALARLILSQGERGEGARRFAAD